MQWLPISLKFKKKKYEIYFWHSRIYSAHKVRCQFTLTKITILLRSRTQRKTSSGTCPTSSYKSWRVSLGSSIRLRKTARSRLLLAEVDQSRPKYTKVDQSTQFFRHCSWCNMSNKRVFILILSLYLENWCPMLHLGIIND